MKFRDYIGEATVKINGLRAKPIKKKYMGRKLVRGMDMRNMGIYFAETDIGWEEIPSSLIEGGFFREQGKTSKTYKSGDKVKVINKNDEFYGMKGTVYKVGKGKQKGYQTVKLSNGQVVSYDDSELLSEEQREDAQSKWERKQREDKEKRKKKQASKEVKKLIRKQW